MTHGPFLRALETIQIPLIEIGGRHLTLGTVIAAAIILAAAYLVSALVRRGIARAMEGEQQTMHATARLTHYVIIGIGISVAIQTAGIDLRALFAAGAVFAVGIGFAMQNIMQNFVSGVILLVEHSIRPGDVLDIDGKQVRVVEMGIRSTRVRSRDDEVLIVPNATLVQATVRSYTLLDTLCRVRVTVGVAYESDMEIVKKALVQAGRNVTGRNTGKDPMIMLNGFAASSVDWEVSIWIDDPWNLRPSASSLREAIWASLLKEDIRIAYPQLDLHVDSKLVDAVTENVGKVVSTLGPRAA